MIKNINKILNIVYQNKKIISVIFLVALMGVFFISSDANAGGIVNKVGETIATGLTWIVHGLVFALGHLLVGIMWILVPVASYSDFVHSPPVEMGWGIVRDICNMFFILILLIIAFATILRVETYNIKKALPKLLIMAVLINFSKTICGVFIDFSQVIMLTFVNSFKEAAGGNITNMLGIADLLRFSYKEYGAGEGINTYSILGAYILALMYLLISIVVMTVLVFTLIYRIVMIWIYVVLSPIAYLTAAFPQGARISSQWWGEFSKNLVVGPMLAFFIWLSFASLGAVDGATIISGQEGKEMFENSPQGIPTQAGSTDHMIKFAISIGMLMGGLMVTQQMGGAFGNMASKGMGAIQKGKGLALSPFKKAKTAALNKVRDGGRLAADVGRATAGAGDRMVGRGLVALGSKVTPDKFKKGKVGRVGAAIGSAIAGGGIVGGTIKGVGNMPGKAIRGVDNWARKDEKVNKALIYAEFNKKEVTDSATGETKERAIANLDDKKWAYNKNNKLQEVEMSKDGSVIKEWKKETKDGEEIDSIKKYKGGKEVGKMNMAKMAWHDSWRSARSGSEAIANKNREEKVGVEQAKILDSNMSKEEMLIEANNASVSQPRKEALALTLAIKKGFRDHNDIANARSVIGENSIMKSKFDDAVYAGQAHIAFDFNAKDKNGNDDIEKQKRESTAFQKKIDSGAIDSKRLDAKAYDNQNILDALEEYHGKEFKPMIETTHKSRGKKERESIETGLLERRDMNNLKEDKSAKIFAKVTGRISEAFNKEDGSVDTDALGIYMKSAKARDINSIELDELIKITQNNNGAQKAEIENTIKNNVSVSQLKSMYKQGDNPDLVRKIRDMIQDESAGGGVILDSSGKKIERSEKAKKIDNDLELSNL